MGGSGGTKAVSSDGNARWRVTKLENRLGGWEKHESIWIRICLDAVRSGNAEEEVQKGEPQYKSIDVTS